MHLPPPTYALLIGPTLLLYPWLRRRAADAASRALVDRAVVGLALLELGLIALYYSRPACWILAAAGAAVLGSVANERAPVRGAAWAAASGVVAGISFQAMGDLDAFVVYFAMGLPLVFGVLLAGVAARWLRWDASPRTTAAALLLVTFAGLFAPSAFAIDFLRRFEVAQLPVLGLTLAGLAFLAGDATRRRGDLRRDAFASMNVGDYVARPEGRLLGIGLGALFLSLLLAVLYVAARFAAGPTPGPVETTTAAVGLLGLLLTLLALRLRRASTHGERPALLATVAAALALVVALAPALGGAHDHFIEGRPTWLAAALAVTGVAATAALLGLAAAWAALADARDRARAVEASSGLGRRLPPSLAVERGTERPSVAALRHFASSLRARGDRVGVLLVAAPTDDALWTVDDDVYAWLEAQDDPDVRVHVGVEDADGVQILPPLFDGETRP